LTPARASIIKMGVRSAIVVVAISIAATGCEREAPAPAPVPAASLAPEPLKPAETPAPKLEPPPVESAPEPPGPEPEKTAAVKPASKTAAPAPSAAPARAVKTVAGTGAAGEGYALAISAQSPVRSGASSAAAVVLSAKDPYKCNDKYPYKLVLDPPSAGVSYPQQTVRGMAVGEKRSTMSVPFSVAQPGSATIAGTLHFSICTADKCLIEKQKVSVTVQAD
jgi:hypothetical protein